LAAIRIREEKEEKPKKNLSISRVREYKRISNTVGKNTAKHYTALNDVI